MSSNGIRDRVAIVGMGCTPFGERWDKSAADLLVDAAHDAYASAGIEQEQVDAGLEGIRKENHAIMLKLVARLVLAEVRAFQCERAE